MGLHDKYTMEEIAANLKNVNEDIVVYGEPWTGGTTPLDASLQCTTANMIGVEGVGAFNDAIRDAIKGSVFDSNVGGWVNSPTNTSVNQATIKSNINGNKFYDPTKQINYVSCHDNNTLYDKLVLTGVSENMISRVDVLAQAIVLTSQGIAFMQAGEEIMRQKINPDGSRNHNSYNSTDEVNSIKWDQKITYLHEYNQYKDLIALRKANESFKLDSRTEVSATYKALTTFGGSKLTGSTIAFELNSEDQKLVVVHNVNSSKIFILRESYKVLFDLAGQFEVGQVITGQFSMEAYSSLILELVTE
jgi:pullulanase